MSTQTLSREEGRTHGQVEVRPHVQVEERHLHKLSVAAEDTELSTLPQATAQNIWENAERLLNDPESISRAPGNDGVYMVVSQTLKKPHFVQVCTSGKIMRNEQCPMWRGRKLCSHSCSCREGTSFVTVSTLASEIKARMQSYQIGHEIQREKVCQPKQESWLEKVVHSTKTHPLQLTGAILMTFVGRR